MLDRRDYGAWLSLLTDDVHYRVTANVNRDADEGPLPYALIDEPAPRLKSRVEQILNAKLTHAENPPSLTRRFVTNSWHPRPNATANSSRPAICCAIGPAPTAPEGALYAGEAPTCCGASTAHSGSPGAKCASTRSCSFTAAEHAVLSAHEQRRHRTASRSRLGIAGLGLAGAFMIRAAIVHPRISARAPRPIRCRVRARLLPATSARRPMRVSPSFAATRSSRPSTSARRIRFMPDRPSKPWGTASTSSSRSRWR